VLDLAESKILIVDDELSVVTALRRILTRHGIRQIWSTCEPRQARQLFTDVRPDLVVLDLRMPEWDGFKVLAQLNELIPAESYLPVLVLTGDTSPEAKREALALGAKDFLPKPFDVVEVTLRIRHLLEARLLHLRLADQNLALEQRVRERTRQCAKAQIEMLQRLAAAGEARDDDTGQHTQRVGTLASRLALAAGLSPRQVSLIRQAAPLHDIGKVHVPDSVLLKPGKLSPEEFEVIKQHTIVGANILAGGHSEVVRMAERIARSHHERWDGTGYLEGLKGEAIPVEARIVAVVDVFDALSHDRPYRPAWSFDRIVEHLRKGRCRQFDPDLCDLFLNRVARAHDPSAGSEPPMPAESAA
jgi:cyclic di-GMP phosphodiesterase